VPAIHLGLNGSGGQVNFLTLDHCTVSTPASNAGAAVYFPQTGNYTPPGLLELRNGSVVQAFAGPGAAAIFAYCARFVIDNSTVTNSGFGLAVSGGSGMYLSTGHEIRNSTISSDGAGIELRSASYGATGVVVESATIVARGTNATALYVQVDSASALSDLLVTNAVLLATNNGGTGILITRGFGGSSFDTLIVDSKVHGRERACLHTGGNSNNDSRDNLRTLRAVFSAGDTNSSVNSASPVVQLSPWASYSVFLERTLIRNGLGGLLVTNISGSYGSSVSLVNVVITDQAQYGVRLRTTGTTDESVLATNCTFSNLGGPVVAYGDNGAGNRYGTFAFCAFAPGAGGGNAAATNLVSEGTAGMLTLSGFTNGLYAYGALTNTLAAVNAAGFSGNVLAPSGDPLLAADGYHLQNGSPLIDVYTLVAGCPTNDIDGRLRPVHARADLGAVEFVSAPGTSILFR
jgi:hypothetical protein